MSRTLLVMSGLALLAVPARAQSFEGSVTYRMTVNGRPAEMTVLQKGNKLRQEMAGPMEGMATITDGSTGKTISLIPQQKMYVVMDLKALGESMKGSGKETPNEGKIPKLTRTGQKETVAGISCDHVLVEPEPNPQQEQVDICAARGMGMFLGLGGANAEQMGATMTFLSRTTDPRVQEVLGEFRDGFFPLKMTMKRRGQPEMTMEATKVDKKSLPNALFEVPAGWTEMKMPAGMRPPR
jgi:hypothetical protein